MNIETLSIIIGAAMPLVIAVIARCDWPAAYKQLTAFAVCIVAAVIVAFVRGELIGVDPVVALGVIYTAAQASYHAFWKPTTIAPKIEAATG